jgi:hypothetical protein
LLDVSSGLPHGLVERSASPRELDDARATVGRIGVAREVSEPLELPQHVVGRLLGEACRRSDLAGSPPMHAGEPEERDHGRGDVWMAGRADARQHFIPTEIVCETQPPDGARHSLGRYRLI